MADDLEQQQVQQVTEPAAGRRRATRKQSASTEAPATKTGTAQKPARSKAATTAADEDPQPEPSTTAGKGEKAAAAVAKKPAAKRKASAPAAAKEKPPYYLVKSEPDEFSIDALKARPNQTEGWEGEGGTPQRQILWQQTGSAIAVQHFQSPYPWNTNPDLIMSATRLPHSTAAVEVFAVAQLLLAAAHNAAAIASPAGFYTGGAQCATLSHARDLTTVFVADFRVM